MNQIFQKSFTLIELLVVIAIIGLLASIVLVSLEGGKERAVIGKAMEFSHTVRVSLGSDLIGEWKFDETSGTTTRDSSGSGNNGTLLPAGSEPLRVDGVFGKALQFDGANDYVIFDGLPVNELTNDITLELWAKSADNSANRQILYPKIEYRLNVEATTGKWFLWYANTVPAGMLVWKSGTNLCDNKWHHIVWSRKASGGLLNVWLDSEQVITNKSDNGNPNQTLHNVIGANQSYSYNFNGIIDEVRAYNRALSATEIQQLYAEGVSRHSLVFNQ